MGIRKPLLFFGLLLLGANQVYAQTLIARPPKVVGDTNIVGAQPWKKGMREISLFNTVISTHFAEWAPALKVEMRINRHFTAGFAIKGRFIFFVGGKVEPFFRYYFTGYAPTGFFLQVKGSVGTFDCIDGGQTPAFQIDPNNPISPLPNTQFYAIGGGACLGYQLLGGRRKNVAFEIFLGYQYIYSSLFINSSYLFQKEAIEVPVDFGMRIGGAF